MKVGMFIDPVEDRKEYEDMRISIAKILPEKDLTFFEDLQPYKASEKSIDIFMLDFGELIPRVDKLSSDKGQQVRQMLNDLPSCLLILWASFTAGLIRLHLQRVKIESEFYNWPNVILPMVYESKAANQNTIKKIRTWCGLETSEELLNKIDMSLKQSLTKIIPQKKPKTMTNADMITVLKVERKKIVNEINCLKGFLNNIDGTIKIFQREEHQTDKLGIPKETITEFVREIFELNPGKWLTPNTIVTHVRLGIHKRLVDCSDPLAATHNVLNRLSVRTNELQTKGKPNAKHYRLAKPVKKEQKYNLWTSPPEAWEKPEIEKALEKLSEEQWEAIWGQITADIENGVIKPPTNEELKEATEAFNVEPRRIPDWILD